MKTKLVKRVLAMAVTMVMMTCCTIGCGSTAGKGKAEGNSGAGSKAETGTMEEAKEAGTETAKADGGTIMWLANISSGAAYDSTVAYLTAICDKLGYKFSVVYGDMFNDAAGNLSSVKNGMTSDVAGLIASQDGGLLSIMEEYPDLYVAGYNTDMNSVYGEGGENAACLENDHFLGTIVDGYASGEDTAQLYFDVVKEKGFKKVAVVNFPAYAYPTSAVAAGTFTKLVEEYNASASDTDKIEIVGETTTLEFKPLEESWFLEEGHDNLDCIVAICAGTGFVYPTLSTAIANGTCSPETRMVTGGFDTDDAIVSDIGDGKTIAALAFSPAEDPAFAIVLLDNAINGKQYADWTNDRVDAFKYQIDSTEDIENVMTKSMCGTADVSLAQLSVEDVCNLCVRNNPDAAYADLVAALHDENTISVAALANR